MILKIRRLKFEQDHSLTKKKKDLTVDLLYVQIWNPTKSTQTHPNPPKPTQDNNMCYTLLVQVN